ncbi:hypothetical protein [Oceanobacillus saliphilus]|uniref:hypothetical protein n=1 Tax=Oceanobacillus saliphilus TaxID=2925834 RepID=UPI00201D9F09|nr:hypothetical protein [Oceanobacillus saliphilus]
MSAKHYQKIMTVAVSANEVMDRLNVDNHNGKRIMNNILEQVNEVTISEVKVLETYWDFHV